MVSWDGVMSLLAEMLAAAVVWLSSFALCQFGVAVETRARPDAAQSQGAKTVARSPRGELPKLSPIAATAPSVPQCEA
jgi:hypothetical protein